MNVGRYQLVEELGKGGMGQVYRAHDPTLNRDVALKVLWPHLAANSDVVRRFQHEAQTGARLSHPNIAIVYEFVPDGPAIAMEFVSGETLAAIIKREGRLRWDPEGMALFAQILDGIEHAHTGGVIHRDIKPANIMVTAQGRVKITDFGIAQVRRQPGLTPTGRLVCTIEYVAPERTLGEKADERSDIYSLGVVLYEMLTGRLPFNSTDDFALIRMHQEEKPTPPRQICPEIPEYVERAILKALEKKPGRRFQRIAEFRQALLLEAPVVWVPRTRPMPAYARPRAQFSRYLIAGAVLAVLTFAVLLVLAVFGSRQQPSQVEAAPAPWLVQAPPASLPVQPSLPEPQPSTPTMPPTEPAIQSPPADSPPPFVATPRPRQRDDEEAKRIAEEFGRAPRQD